MDRDLVYYVVTYYSALMTPEENVANRHLTATFKFTGGRSDPGAQEEARRHRVYSRWISDDPAILRVASAGLEGFRERVAKRILAEHRDGVFLNYCPRCGGLTRTPKARLCLHCGHNWHPRADGDRRVQDE